MSKHLEYYRAFTENAIRGETWKIKLRDHEELLVGIPHARRTRIQDLKQAPFTLRLVDPTTNREQIVRYMIADIEYAAPVLE